MAEYDSDDHYDDDLSYDTASRRIVGRNSVKIKTTMEGLGGRDQVEKLRSTITGLTNSPKFQAPNPLPNPPLADATEIADTAEEKIEAHEAAVALVKLRRTEKNDALKAVRQTYKGFAGYVTSVANDDPTVAQTANMDLVPMPAPIGEVLAPNKVTARTNGVAGAAKIHWPRSRGATHYVVQRATGNPNDPASWETLDTVSAASFADTGLTSGTKYWYRVAAKGFAGLSGWSQAVCVMAP